MIKNSQLGKFFKGFFYKILKRGTENGYSVFKNIYKKNLWGGESGPGSDPGNAEPYLRVLQEYLGLPEVKSIVDLGCGDWRLMRTVKIADWKEYYGFDVVDSLIAGHKKKYERENVRFRCIRGLEEILEVKGDLLIVKDVLQHWPNELVQYFIEKILPNFRYALITNDCDPIDGKKNNSDIELGSHRFVDLEAEPFNIDRNIKVVLDYQALWDLSSKIDRKDPASYVCKRVYLCSR